MSSASHAHSSTVSESPVRRSAIPRLAASDGTEGTVSPPPNPPIGSCRLPMGGPGATSPESGARPWLSGTDGEGRESAAAWDCAAGGSPPGGGAGRPKEPTRHNMQIRVAVVIPGTGLHTSRGSERTAPSPPADTSYRRGRFPVITARPGPVASAPSCARQGR